MTDPIAGTRLDHAQYVEHLRRESARFAEALALAPDDARVPTCPDWDAVDLLWHLGEVQAFWSDVLRVRPKDPEAAGIEEPDRPTDRRAVAAFGARASSDLETLLAQIDPREEAWSWVGEPTVAWVARRQAHEALLHRVDAELTAGVPATAVDDDLALDGVDEALRQMFGGAPAWATVTVQEGRTVRVLAQDDSGVRHSWRLTLARFSGTSPNTGKTYDEATLVVDDVDDGTPTAATITGPAVDLDLALWNRSPRGAETDAETDAAVRRSGDAAVLAEFDAVVTSGIQ